MKIKKRNQLLSLFLGLLTSIAIAQVSQVLPDSAELEARNSLQLTNEDRPYLLKSLERFGVTVNQNEHYDKTMTVDLLFFLSEFFLHTPPSKEIRIEPTDANGVTLIWANEDKSVYYISQNASENLLATAVRKEAAAKGIDVRQIQGKIELVYSYKLFKQLFELQSKESVVDYIRMYLRYELDPQSENYVEFKESEANKILTLLTDIPKHLHPNEHLEEIQRLADAKEVKDEKPLPVQFLDGSKRLEVYDNAFEEMPALSEHPFTNGFCHALSAGLDSGVREDFFNIGWKKLSPEELRKWFTELYGPDFEKEFPEIDLTTLVMWQPRPDSKETVGSMSLRSPQEDFNDSCAHFIHQEKLLKDKAPTKYEFLLNKVFLGISFENKIPSILQTFLEPSLAEDTEPPYLESTPKKSVDMKVRLSYDKLFVILECEFKGVRDDISGVRRVWATIQAPFSMDLFFCSTEVDGKRENDLVVAKEEIPIALAPDNFYIYSFRAEDMAGNQDYWDTVKRIEVDPEITKLIAAAKAKLKKPKFDLDFDSIELDAIKHDGLGTVIDFTLPIEHHRLLDSVFLDFVFEDGEREIGFNASYGRPSILSEPGENIRGRLFLSEKYPKGTYRIKNVTISINKRETESTTLGDLWYYRFPVNKAERQLENLSFFHDTDNEDTTPPTFDMNGIVIEENVNPDGTASVIVQVPTEGLDMEKFNGIATIETPNGDTIHGHIDYGSPRNLLKFQADLPKHYQSGEYGLKSLSIDESPKTDHSLGGNPTKSDFGETRQEFREKTIKRKIEFTDGSDRHF